MPEEPPESGKCFDCDVDCSNEDYCYGCRTFICRECARNGTLVGWSHEPVEHLSEAEDEEEDDE